jgi:hypothetical protein
MPLLRLEQRSETQPDRPDLHHVRIELEAEGKARRTAEARFSFELSDQEAERLRWYLEDFIENPHEPAPTIAARVEGEMQTAGATQYHNQWRNT